MERLSPAAKTRSYFFVCAIHENTQSASTGTLTPRQLPKTVASTHHRVIERARQRNLTPDKSSFHWSPARHALNGSSGSRRPTLSSARRFSATLTEGTPTASSTAPRSEDRRGPVASWSEPAALVQRVRIRAPVSATRPLAVARRPPKLAVPIVGPPSLPVLQRSAHSLAGSSRLRWWVGTACASQDYY
jgi:hypothetical protein